MHEAHLRVQPLAELERDNCALGPMSFFQIEDGLLLRKRSGKQEVYGILAYEDPYLDYVAVGTLSVGSGFVVATTWTGTHREFYARWEPAPMKGAT